MTNADQVRDGESQHGTASVCISGSPTQVVRIEGDVDLANAYDIDHRVSVSYRPEVDHVVIDLGGTTYLDRAGLAMLVRISSRLRAARTTVTVVAPPQSVAHRVITLSGLADELSLAGDRTAG